MAPICERRYPVHFVAVDIRNTRTIFDPVFSLLKREDVETMRACRRNVYASICRMSAAFQERTEEGLQPILGKKFMGKVKRNFSNFERHQWIMKQKTTVI